MCCGEICTNICPYLLKCVCNPSLSRWFGLSLAHSSPVQSSPPPSLVTTGFASWERSDLSRSSTGRYAPFYGRYAPLVHSITSFLGDGVEVVLGNLRFLRLPPFGHLTVFSSCLSYPRRFAPQIVHPFVVYGSVTSGREAPEP